MRLDAVRDYCLALPGVTEGQPFGDDVLVFKVGPKMFCLMNLTWMPPGVNLKCDPERALELRAEHEAIRPGYHMNKRHWNTVMLDGRLPPALVRTLIDHSYALVRASLPRAERARLDAA